MEVSYELLPKILLYSLVIFVIYYALYKKFIFSVIDPLFIYLFNTTFASVLVISVVNEHKYIIHFFICQVCLLLGIYIVNRKYHWNNIIKYRPSYVSLSDYKLLDLAIYVFSFVYISANIIIFYTKGFALLSDAPTESKVANFQQGFGVFRKINWSIGGVLGSSLFVMILVKPKKIYILLLGLLVLFTALEGSKSSLLRIIISAALVLYHPVFQKKQDIIKKYIKYIPVGIIGLLTVFFTVLIKENETPELAIFAFFRRLLYSADSVLYFYNPVNQDYFGRYSFFDYPSYILNPVLGFLRVMPYQEAFGNIMVDNTLPSNVILDVIVGPNTSFYIEGQIFFGYFGAFLYSFIIGLTYAFIRIVYFSLVKCPAFLLAFIGYICQLIMMLLVDVNLFITQFFDTCFFVLPIYIGVCFIKHKKIVIRRPQFTLRRLVL